MKWIFILLALLALPASAEQEKGADQKRVNPFANAEAEVKHAESSQGGDGGAFVLKAVMPSPDHPLANIDGEILAVGEAYRGYLLAEVTDDSAVLARGTSVIQLFIHQPDRNHD